MAAVDQYATSLLESGEPPVQQCSVLRNRVVQCLGVVSLWCVALASSMESPRAQWGTNGLSGTFQLSVPLATTEATPGPQWNQHFILVGTVFFALFFVSLKRSDLTGLYTPAWSPSTSDNDAVDDTGVEPGAMSKVIWVLQLMLEVAGAGLIVVGALKLKLPLPLPATIIGSVLITFSLLITILKLFSSMLYYWKERVKHFEFGVHLTRDHKIEWQRPNKLIMLSWMSLWKMVTIIGAMILITAYSLPYGALKSILLLVGHTVFASCFFFGSLNIACKSGRLVGEDTYGSEIELGKDPLYETIQYRFKKFFQFKYDTDFEICGQAAWYPVTNLIFWWGFIGLYFGSLLIAFGGAYTGATVGEVPLKTFALAWLIPVAHFCVLLPCSSEPKDMPILALLLFMCISTAVQLAIPSAVVAVVGLVFGLSPSKVPVVPAGCCVLLSVMLIAVTIFTPRYAGNSYMVAPGQKYTGLLQNAALIGALLCIMGHEM